ncbi:RNA polymerase [Parasitella parasitica]|nr:RNA polymerase [Parasitella parasitica]
MDANNNEATRLWRVFRTAHQMVHDRGYLVSQSELDMDLESFKRSFALAMMCVSSRDQLTFVVQKKDDPIDQLLVFFPKDSSVGVKPLRVYVERMAQQQIPKGVCIYQKSMTSSANKVIQSLPSKHTLESFQENELLVNITHHVLVPKHEVLTTEEKATLLQRYRLKETQLPRIQHTDPVARYYGLKRGQVVKILRESETAGRYVSYRLCI